MTSLKIPANDRGKLWKESAGKRLLNRRLRGIELIGTPNTITAKRREILGTKLINPPEPEIPLSNPGPRKRSRWKVMWRHFNKWMAG